MEVGVSSDNGDGRGQSSPIAVVLVFGLVIGATTVTLLVGGVAITDTQDNLGILNAENAMTQLSSEVSLVATGGGNSQTTTLPANSGGTYRLNESAGRLTVAARNASGSTELLTTELGKVTYRNGDSAIAYQGGGVWRGGESAATMISPPDVFYRNGTLTVQPINITGSVTSGGDVTIRKTNTADDARSLHSSLENRNIFLRVKSQYYRGWGQYFESRTNSNVTYDHENNTVIAKLVPPPTPIEIDAGIVSSGNLSVNSGSADIVGPVSLGGVKVNTPHSVSSNSIEENQTENKALEEASSKIADAATRLSSESAPADTGQVTAGSYYVTDDSLFGDQTTFNTTNGDIEIYVDGDVRSNKEVEVVGNNDVDIYVDGTFKMKGQPVWGDSSKIGFLTVYSKQFTRVTEFYGVVYTDEVNIKGKGGKAGLVGALISTDDNIQMGGNAQVTYDSSLDDRTLIEVQPKYATILYLHVSESRVRLN